MTMTMSHHLNVRLLASKPKKPLIGEIDAAGSLVSSHLDSIKKQSMVTRGFW